MATANDLIAAAFKRGRILGADQVMGPSEAADALATANRMLDTWWIDRLAVFQVVQENFALVAGQSSRTIGVGGNFNTTWPVKIVDGCFVRRSGVDYPISVINDRVQYDRIRVKTSSGLPSALFYDRAYPLGTINFYYTPDAADQVYLNSWKRLQVLAALVTPISLPPGYEDLFVDGLAIKLCPDYGMSAPLDVKLSFSTTKKALGQLNAPSLVMSIDPNLLPQGRSYDIRSG